MLARQGERARAESMLGELRRLRSDAPVLGLIVSAAHLEVAGLIWGADAKVAQRLLESGVKIRALEQRASDFPAILDVLRRWERAIERARSGKLDARSIERELLACGRIVGY